MHKFYKNDRQRAWRNLLVGAVNEGLRIGAFDLLPGTNAWPDDASFTYPINLPDGRRAAAHLSDAGFDEIAIRVAVDPIVRLLGLSWPSLKAGGAVAHGFLERRKGAWLQATPSLFRCRAEMLYPIARLEIEPEGFADHGRIVF